MWIRDFHIDGLRLDAVHAFIDRSAIHFLEQLATEVELLSTTLARRVMLIAESDLNDPRIVTPREAGGFGVDAQWSDDFHHAVFAVLSPKQATGYYRDFGELSLLAKALERTFVYDGVYSKFRNRVHGRRANNLSQHRFVGYIQNHDQVGNRAVGDRIVEIAGFDRAKIAAAIVLMSPFIPMLFQGEEWAVSSPFLYFADHDDPELARLVSEGRKSEFLVFGWDPQSIPDPENRETFSRSKLKWDERGEGEHAEMLDWYRALICLRRGLTSLNDGEPGNTRVLYSNEEMWFSMERGDVTVNCNLGATERRFAVPPDRQIVLGSRGVSSVNDGFTTVPPDTVIIITSGSVPRLQGLRNGSSTEN
jgi:maltooligosyltrehalose trehalohydrolase